MGGRYRKKTYRRKIRRTKRKFGLRRMIKKSIYSMAETKIKVQNFTNVSVTSTANQEVNWADAIAQGTNADTRIGNQIACRNVSFDIQMYFSETVASTAYVRVLVLYPRKGVNTTDITTQITASYPGCHQRPDPYRWITLYDRKALVSGANTGNGYNNVHFKFFKRFNMCKWNYDNLGTIETQPILYIASDASAIANDEVILNGTYSMSYKDI